MTSPIVITLGSSILIFDFLHTNKVSSCILIRYRFTNKRRPSTMETIKTISWPRLARDSEP